MTRTFGVDRRLLRVIGVATVSTSLVMLGLLAFRWSDLDLLAALYLLVSLITLVNGVLLSRSRGAKTTCTDAGIDITTGLRDQHIPWELVEKVHRSQTSNMVALHLKDGEKPALPGVKARDARDIETIVAKHV
ncbi:MAG: PH domain-containing protein [Ornithinimicrobium sp.]